MQSQNLSILSSLEKGFESSAQDGLLSEKSFTRILVASGIEEIIADSLFDKYQDDDRLDYVEVLEKIRGEMNKHPQLPLDSILMGMCGSRDDRDGSGSYDSVDETSESMVRKNPISQLMKDMNLDGGGMDVPLLKCALESMGISTTTEDLELIVNSIDNKGEGVEFTYFLEFVRQKIGSQTLEAISMDEAVRLTAKTIREEDDDFSEENAPVTDTSTADGGSSKVVSVPNSNQGFTDVWEDEYAESEEPANAANNDMNGEQQTQPGGGNPFTIMISNPSDPNQQFAISFDNRSNQPTVSLQQAPNQFNPPGVSYAPYGGAQFYNNQVNQYAGFNQPPPLPENQTQMYNNHPHQPRQFDVDDAGYPDTTSASASASRERSRKGSNDYNSRGPRGFATDYSKLPPSQRRKLNAQPQPKVDQLRQSIRDQRHEFHKVLRQELKRLFYKVAKKKELNMIQFGELMKMLNISQAQFKIEVVFQELCKEGKTVDYISFFRAFRRSIVKNPENDVQERTDPEVLRDAILRCWSSLILDHTVFESDEPLLADRNRGSRNLGVRRASSTPRRGNFNLRKSSAPVHTDYSRQIMMKNQAGGYATGSMRNSRRGKQALIDLSPSQQERTRILSEPSFLGGDIDVLDIVKKGTTLLKQGQRGSPHYRRFQMAGDGAALMWYSVKKPLEHTTIYVSDMHHCGMKVTLEPDGWFCSDHEASIIIVYGAKKRTLELVCRNRVEARIWVEAISYLIKQHNKGVSLERIRRYYHYIEDKTGQGIAPCFQAPHERSQQIYNQSIEALKRRWTDADSILQNDILRESNLHEHLVEEIASIQSRITRIESSADQSSVEMFNTIHLTQIELQTLKEKFIVLEQRLGGAVGSHGEGEPPIQRKKILRNRNVAGLRSQAGRKPRSYSEGNMRRRPPRHQRINRNALV